MRDGDAFGREPARLAIEIDDADALLGIDTAEQPRARVIVRTVAFDRDDDRVLEWSPPGRVVPDALEYGARNKQRAKNTSTTSPVSVASMGIARTAFERPDSIPRANIR